jgi:hypothetical protein
MQQFKCGCDQTVAENAAETDPETGARQWAGHSSKLLETILYQEGATATRAFCLRFPNSVARDTRLSETSVVILGYRATFADDRSGYGLNETNLRGIVRGKGFGRNVIERGIAESRAAGYLRRWQGGRKSDGTFSYAVDAVDLPPAGATGKARRIVLRSWFNGSLTLKEMAALIYMRAGTGKGPRMYARELAVRFGWSRPTAAKVIEGLRAKALITQTQGRRPDGTLDGVTYAVVPKLPRNLATASVKKPGHGAEATTVKKPGHGSPGHGFPGHTRRVPLHGDTSYQPPHVRELTVLRPSCLSNRPLLFPRPCLRL